jgi:hypothetical protein
MPGHVTRIRDIARVELGAQDYNRNAYLDNKVATAIAVYQRPGSNALATAESIGCGGRGRPRADSAAAVGAIFLEWAGATWPGRRRCGVGCSR